MTYSFRDNLEFELFEALSVDLDKESKEHLADIINDSSDNDLANLAFIHNISLEVK